MDAGREERDLAPGPGRPPDDPEAGRARVLSAGRLRRSGRYGVGVRLRGRRSPSGPWSASGVGHGAGAVPGRGEELRRHRPDRGQVGRLRVAVTRCFFGWTSGARMTTLVTSSRPTSSMIAARSGSRSTGTSERIVSPTASSRSGSLNRRLPPRVAWLAEREQDLLLAGLAGEVALADAPCATGHRRARSRRRDGAGRRRSRSPCAVEPEAVVGRVVERAWSR